MSKAVAVNKQPSENTVLMMHLIYGLHAFSAVTGLITAAFILTAFLTGWPSIVALILSYIKKGDAQGTYMQSHYDWMIQTFWVSFLFVCISAALFVTVIGIPLAYILVVGTGLWVLYRIAKGWLKLINEQPVL